MDRAKRELRQLKRAIKRAGTRRRRRQGKRELAERPEDAPFTEFDFGRCSSTRLNGMDRDATRRAVRDLIRQEFGIDRAERTVGE